MTAPPSQRPPPPQRIRLDQPEQLREWAARFGISVHELARIVAEVGDDPDKVWACLNTRA